MKFERTVARVEPGGLTWWCSQLLPPLAILLLVYVPLNFGLPSLLWLGAMAAAFVSALSLLLRWTLNIVDRDRWDCLMPPPRPVIAIVAMLLAFKGVAWS